MPAVQRHPRTAPLPADAQGAGIGEFGTQRRVAVIGDNGDAVLPVERGGQASASQRAARTATASA
jgi:hypothetical protein